MPPVWEKLNTRGLFRTWTLTKAFTTTNKEIWTSSFSKEQDDFGPSSKCSNLIKTPVISVWFRWTKPVQFWKLKSIQLIVCFLLLFFCIKLKDLLLVQYSKILDLALIFWSYTVYCAYITLYFNVTPFKLSSTCPNMCIMRTQNGFCFKVDRTPPTQAD